MYNTVKTEKSDDQLHGKFRESAMRLKNVCKFITSENDERLKMINFVLERDEVQMAIDSRFSYTRAILICQGSGVMRFDGQEFPISKGCLIFAFEGEIFRVDQPSGLEYIYISFEGGRGQALMKRYGISKANRIFTKCETLIPFWQESISRAEESNIDIVSEAALLYAFSRLSGNTGEKEDAVAMAIAFLEENFNDTELSLADASEELGYNPKYLSHIFKEKMGMSFTEYLRMLRIKQAILLFDHGIDAVKNVAILSGFSDPLYFSSVFKKQVGVSPKEYKERIASVAKKTDREEGGL